MSSQPLNYYQVLGLLPTAKPDEIKRRYRELARRCHPDVAKTPDAANRFRDINEANSVLSDPAKRANYDAQWKLEELKRQGVGRGVPGVGEKRPPTTDRRPPNPVRAETQRQSDKSTGKSGQSPPGGTRHPAPDTRHPSPDDPAAQLLHEAQRAMSRLKYREAEVLARRANRARRTSLGYEILGDIFRVRGSADEAVAMYSYALQLDRSNRDVQMKFDRLVGQKSGPTMAGSAARAARHRPSMPKAGNRASAMGASAIGVSAIVFLVFASTRIGSPATGPWFFEWDPLYLFALAASGGILGFLLALNGVLPQARRVLFTGEDRHGKPAVPAGPLVIAFGILSFYASLAVFLVVGFLTDHLPKPMILAFASAFAVTLVFAIVNPAAALWTLLSGGSLVFLGLLAGWDAGGSFGSEVRR